MKYVLNWLPAVAMVALGLIAARSKRISTVLSRHEQRVANWADRLNRRLRQKICRHEELGAWRKLPKEHPADLIRECNQCGMAEYWP